ncbi:HEAT repeat domain-containing protein [Salinicoccus sp. ID82-1]|uniref:HEAT repeat domain-containing protein n=1 Tax=Salinicoccus sp. ID82-1 TaxID=2820269 RepID=UPI001F179439|nr:HEAT repeat domain-containing protein [Salinicoccus sp. ID82-1]MCG1010314.1 HEAT repeat domain-containing protein [Salinicoccus sp. ID82-1]
MGVSISLNVVLWCILALVVILAALVVVFITQSQRRIRRRDEVARYIERHLEDWYEYLAKGDGLGALPRSKDADVEAIEKIFFAFKQNASSKDIDGRIIQVATEHLAPRYRRQLKSGKWACRVNTLSKLIEFELPGFETAFTNEEILRLSRYEYFLFLSYLSIFDMDRFLHIYFLRKDLSEYENKKVFNQLSDRKAEKLIGRFEEIALPGKYALIGRISLMPSGSSIEFLESLLGNRTSEVRIRALKAIQSIGHVQESCRYDRFYNSDVWEERLLVTRIAPLIGESSISQLKERLDDPHEMVRREAARSLSRFREPMVKWAIPMQRETLTVRKEGEM